MRVTGFDHLVLRCFDVETTLAWYRDVIGLDGVRVDEWRRGEVPFPSIRVDEGTIIDLLPGLEFVREAGAPGPERLDHLCLVIDPIDLAELAASGTMQVVDGPAPRYGARGMGTSLYVLDPDGLTVELRHY